jgi:hypothetical protein
MRAAAPKEKMASSYPIAFEPCIQVQLVWGLGLVPLSAAGREAIQSLMKSVSLGR